MKAVLRFGALAVGVALAAGGVGEAAAQQRRAKRPAAARRPGPGERRRRRRSERQGPARMSPAHAKFAELPRIEDAEGCARGQEARRGHRGPQAPDPEARGRHLAQGGLLYHLSELYREKSKYLYRLEMDRHLEAEKNYDAARRARREAGAPKEDHRDSERYRARDDEPLRGHPARLSAVRAPRRGALLAGLQPRRAGPPRRGGEALREADQGLPQVAVHAGRVHPARQLLLRQQQADARQAELREGARHGGAEDLRLRHLQAGVV